MRKYYLIFILLSVCLSQHEVRAQEYELVIVSEKNVPQKIQKGYSKIKVDSSGIQIYLKQLLDNLYREGFISAGIDSVKFDSIKAWTYLFIGKKYIWGDVNLSYLEPALKKSLKIKDKNFKVVNLFEFFDLKNEILSFYENSGYPFVKVQLDTLNIKDSVIQATLLVNKGKFYTIDSLIIKGDVKISYNYLSNFLQIEHGMPFNQERISSIKEKINNLNFISEIKPAEIEFKEKAVDVYVYLQNKKANVFSGIIGFLPDTKLGDNDESKSLLITGNLKLKLINSIGKGEELSLNWEKLESYTQKLDVGLGWSYILKTKLGLDANFGLYKKDTSYLSLNTALGLRVFLTDDDFIKAYYRYKSSTKIQANKGLSKSIGLADVKSNIIGANYNLTELDYKYNPARGLELNIFAGTGFKNISNTERTTDSLQIVIDNKTLELEAGLNLNIYYPVYNNFIFHFGNETRYLDQLKDNDKEAVFFENELYRFGGANSLRGFDENAFFASIYSIQNVEIRYLFEKNSAFYIFWNGAYYYSNIAKSVTEDFPWGVGIGLNFETKAGIFSLSYALGKQFNNPIEVKTAKIHVGYISRF